MINTKKKFVATAHAVSVCIMLTSCTYALNERGRGMPAPKTIQKKDTVIETVKPHQPTTTKYYDKHPKYITKDDLDVLEKVDKESYTIAEQSYSDIRIDLIYKFIITHKVHREEYSKLKVTSTLDLGSRTRNPYSNSYNYNFDDGKQFYSAYVELTYPLWDAKTEKRIANEKLTYNLQILDRVEKYAEAYNEVLNYKEELELLRMKQRVWKGEYISGVKYRDERLQLLETMRKSKVNLRKARHTLHTIKLYLFTLTTDPRGLNKLLGGNL